MSEQETGQAFFPGFEPLKKPVKVDSVMGPSAVALIEAAFAWCEAQGKDGTSEALAKAVERYASVRSGRSAAQKRVDGLIETLGAEEYGTNTKLNGQDWRRMAVAAGQITMADPDVTPNVIRARARNYRSYYPGIEFTAMGLAKHWTRCANPPMRKHKAEQFTMEQAFERSIREATK